MKSREQLSSSSEVDVTIQEMESQFSPEETVRPLGMTAFEALASEASVASFDSTDGLTYCSTGAPGGPKGGQGGTLDQD
jgi:hypothetical protein